MHAFGTFAPMSQVKLDLRNKNVPEKIQKGREIEQGLGTPVAPAYATLAADLKAATDALEEKSNEAVAADSAASNAHTLLDTAESTFDRAFSSLGKQVEITTKGDEVAIKLTNFDVRSAPSSVQSLDAVHAFAVTTTNVPGAFDMTWDKLDGASSYELRGRKVTDPDGQYPYSKILTKTRYRASGFESGVAYEFQIRAHGPREMESPWSNPFRKIPS